MPDPQAQSEIPQEAVAKFHSLSPDQQQQAIGRMTPDLKSRFLPAAQEYKAMHAPDSAYPTASPPQPQPVNTMSRAIDKVAGFTTRNAPTIAGAVGGIAGSRAGLPGSVAGAAAGGAIGSAIKSKAEGGNVDLKEAVKDAAKQGTLDLAGGLAGKGIAKVAGLMGVDEALMKFALKRGEDFSRDLNPSAAMNKFRLQSMTTRDLYQKASQKIGSLSKSADAMIDQVGPYSSTIRPFAIAKGVLDRYEADALKVGDHDIASATSSMLKNLSKEFNNASTGAQGAARAAGVPAKAAEQFPTDKLMTTKEANQLKQVWGDSVQWGKEPPKDSLQAAYKTIQNARRDIYHALNDSIADAMGGNQGRAWRSTNHDIFNLMEAKGALQEAGERVHSDATGLVPRVLDSMRKPGVASMMGAGARNIPANLSRPGVISNIGRGASMGADAMLHNDLQQNPIPLPH